MTLNFLNHLSTLLLDLFASVETRSLLANVASLLWTKSPMCTNVSVCVCACVSKNYSHTQIKGEALRFLATLLLIVYISIHAHARTHAHVSPATLDPSSLVAPLAAGGYDLSGDLLGLFSVETAGGWLILYLKGSGLDSRLVAQRKSIVDVEVTQAAFKQTVGSHLSGIRVCVTWRRRRHSPQFYPQEGRVPEGFWRSCCRDFAPPPTPLQAGAAHTQHILSTEQDAKISGHEVTQQSMWWLFLSLYWATECAGNPSVWAIVGLVRGQSDKKIMLKNGDVWNVFLNSLYKHVFKYLKSLLYVCSFKYLSWQALINLVVWFCETATVKVILILILTQCKTHRPENQPADFPKCTYTSNYFLKVK